MHLEIKIQEVKPKMFTIIPEGRIDSDTYLQFQKKVQPLVDKKAKNVLINMAKVDYISSAGLNAIFNLMKKVRENNGELLLCNLQPQIKKVFEIIKALPTTNIFTRLQEADDYLSHIMKQELDKKAPGKK